MARELLRKAHSRLARERQIERLPEAQVQCYGQGYLPTESDLADMQRLQERFGVVLPLILCRQPATIDGGRFALS
jgi:hypothetical protein